MRELILVVCWLGVLQSLLLSIYFLTVPGRSMNRFFLGIALLLTGVRAAKSTLFLFWTNLPVLIINVGFAAHAAIGPILLLYIISFRKAFRWRNQYYLHFIPAVLILVFSNFLLLESFWYRGGYALLLFYTLAYVMLVAYLFVKSVDDWTHSRSRGVALLLIAFGLFLLSYFSNYVLRVSEYVQAPLLYAMLIFLISFLCIRNNSLFTVDGRRKYQNVNLSDDDVSHYQRKLLHLLIEEKMYLHQEVSLQLVSDRSGIPGYALSYILNEKLKTSFTGLVNQHRVEEAARQLVDPAKMHLSIASVAYDCGFNTLSSFNTAFKRIKGLTPSEFRKTRNKTD